MLWIAEIQLVGVAFGLHSDRRFDDIGNRWARHASLDPIEGHLFRRHIPDLLIVRYQIFLGDAFAENMVDPLFEVGRLTIVILQIIVQTLEAIFWCEIIEAVFERVFDVSAIVPDLVVAAPLGNVIAELPMKKVENFLVARKQDVRTAEIKGVAVLDEALTMAPYLCFKFENFAFICVATAADNQAHEPAAEYTNLHDSRLPEPRPSSLTGLARAPSASPPSATDRAALVPISQLLSQIKPPGSPTRICDTPTHSEAASAVSPGIPSFPRMTTSAASRTPQPPSDTGSN